MFYAFLYYGQHCVNNNNIAREISRKIKLLAWSNSQLVWGQAAAYNIDL